MAQLANPPHAVQHAIWVRIQVPPVLRPLQHPAYNLEKQHTIVLGDPAPTWETEKKKKKP